jgi:hypothetical protein
MYTNGVEPNGFEQSGSSLLTRLEEICMVGPPYSAMLYGGFFRPSCVSRSAASQQRAPILGTEESMDASLIFVIVLIALFLGAMIGLQVYIHTGKKGETEEQKGGRG